MNRADIFQEYRPQIFSLAYRMLGTITDAEDIAQESYLRWEQADNAVIRDPKAFLTTVATNLCLNHLGSARVRREQYVGPWLPEPFQTDSYADPTQKMALAESLSFAFLLLLERLAPVERAVFLLREVFDYDYAEVAAIVDKSEANCRQMVRRARSRLREGRPRFAASPGKVDELTHRFLQACREGDLDGLVGLLANDVRLVTDGGGKVFAALQPIVGVKVVAQFIMSAIRKFGSPDTETAIVSINGRPGIINYNCEGTPQRVISIDVSEASIAAIYIVGNPQKLGALARIGPGLSKTATNR